MRVSQREDRGALIQLGFTQSKDIAGFDVMVNDPFLMCVLDCIENIDDGTN